MNASNPQNQPRHIVQTAGRDQLGKFAPEFAYLNDEVLFGQVWNRQRELSLRDRSLITVTSLIAMGMADSSFEYHLQTAKNNGITKSEIAEAITHAAFYVGWPKAWAAFRYAKRVWADDDIEATSNTDNMDASRKAFERTLMFPIGAPNDAYAAYFDGQSYLAPLCGGTLPVANVTFEPGCRNHWHTHRATDGGGQLLICVGGHGWYQERGKAAQALDEGDIVSIPANTEHWHGAASDSWFSHLAIAIPGTDTSNEWGEPVDTGEYDALDWDGARRDME